jgi:drug/metabolite transporter (DMT)-like permease
MKFAKYTFYAAGIYGLIALLPQYFLEAKNGRDYPPAITHPEYYYGFLGVTIAFQVVFLFIASDPARYRPLMLLAALLEKFPFTIAVYALYALGRVHSLMVVFGTIDLILGLLFIVSFLKTKKE